MVVRQWMELNLETFPLPPLIDEVVKTIEPLAAKNGNQVAVHCDSAIGMMHTDQMRLRQALLNLMSNANKFTEKGTVTIAAHQEHDNGRDWVTLSVADTGSRWASCSRSFPRLPRPPRASTAARAWAL
jgi:signal transduction histidine kinase